VQRPFPTAIRQSRVDKSLLGVFSKLFIFNSLGSICAWNSPEISKRGGILDERISTLQLPEFGAVTGQ
jgi:hypothetical protein